LPPASADNGEKIRIGYLSGDFRAQATSFLLVGVLEQHDASRFEIHAFDNGWDDGSETRKRIDAAVHRVVNIRGLGDAQAARDPRQRDRHSGQSQWLFRRRPQPRFRAAPAPVQVNYLGFPGTLGAPYMDYIVADPIVIPDAQRTFFTEKVVHLPHSYQANDNRRAMSNRVFSRSDFGLPQDGFVFCCFNNNYKITPQTFDGWMRILAHVPGSVLWLIEDNALASNNLGRKRPRAASIRRGWCSQRAWSRTNIWRGTAAPICFSIPCPITPIPPQATRCGPDFRYSHARAALSRAAWPQAC
jgi:predicted O-linked N-acetylglucosamine transferase (SPINDLY family)